MDSAELLVELVSRLGFSDSATTDRFGEDMFAKNGNTQGLEVLLRFLFQRHKGTKQAHKVRCASSAYVAGQATSPVV